MARSSRSEGRERRPSGRPGSPRARLFLALDPPPAARRELAAWRDALIAGRDDLRPVAPEALHVTLVFLGYRAEKEIGAIAATAFEPLRGLAPVRLEPSAVRPLPPRGPRLFALDLADPGEACTALQAGAERALADARFHRPEKRPFWPHMTLARVKRERRAGPLEPEGGLPTAFTAADVVLYRSHLSPKGARYEPLERLSLG